ncbi:HAD-IG family 5'-nucleotidase [Legionella sp. W05-934-2]|uniref:HAD-IG family 5'-nucleotidase n=1 Tax=Legionella sp. W05-934-2 TaxID=1198649 RepID=UPI003461E026
MSAPVFINRLLNMKKIKYIGLDMDHTLIRYHTERFEHLVFHLVTERLVKHKNYPEEVLSFKFNYHDAIRGLVIDIKRGNIIKLSRFGAIRNSFHGTRPLSYEEQKDIYYSVYVDLGDKDYIPVDTAFSIAYCVLYQQLVDLKDKYPHLLPDYECISEDVYKMVDLIHADGSLKNKVKDNLEDYVIRDEALVEGLINYIDSGKKFFILTNSDYWYSNLLLDFAINPFLEKGKTWLDLFEYVITFANKPRFFFDNLKFLHVNPESGLMSNLSGPMVPGVYQGGNATAFTNHLKVSGDEILYIGDHIYGDIVRLKKDCNWRTALVVEELGQEIEGLNKTKDINEQINQLMKEKEDLEEQILYLNMKPRAERSESKIKEILAEIADVDAELAQLIQKMETAFNPLWGRVFRSGAEETYFAYQMERFACIYMEKLSHLLQHSPMSYFRATRRLLPHEIKTML